MKTLVCQLSNEKSFFIFLKRINFSISFQYQLFDYSWFSFLSDNYKKEISSTNGQLHASK